MADNESATLTPFELAQVDDHLADLFATLPGITDLCVYLRANAQRLRQGADGEKPSAGRPSECPNCCSPDPAQIGLTTEPGSSGRGTEAKCEHSWHNVDLIELSPEQELIMGVLAGQYRAGEHFCSFEDRLTRSIEQLVELRLVSVTGSVIEGSVRASLSEAGRKRQLGADYQQPETNTLNAELSEALRRIENVRTLILLAQSNGIDHRGETQVRLNDLLTALDGNLTELPESVDTEIPVVAWAVRASDGTVYVPGNPSNPLSVGGKDLAHSVVTRNDGRGGEWSITPLVDAEAVQRLRLAASHVPLRQREALNQANAEVERLTAELTEARRETSGVFTEASAGHRDARTIIADQAREIANYRVAIGRVYDKLRYFGGGATDNDCIAILAGILNISKPSTEPPVEPAPCEHGETKPHGLTHIDYPVPGCRMTTWCSPPLGADG